MTRNQGALESFTVYCKLHPGERFWQALRNWSNFGFILGSNVRDGATLDTFNIEGLDGTRTESRTDEPYYRVTESGRIEADTNRKIREMDGR